MAKIKLTAGKLYFLREKDYLTGEISRYVKIGLVRNEKDTEKRILEHQTGNPREIYDYCSLDTPFVEHLETQIHYRFADNWIIGEWFNMSFDQTNDCIEHAKQIILEQEEIRPTLIESYELGSKPSSNNVISASEIARKIWSDLVEVKLEIDRINALKSITKNQIQSFIGYSGGIDGIAKIQIKTGSTYFDEAHLLLDHSQLHASYNNLVKESLSGNFTLKGKKSLKTEDADLHDRKQNLPKIDINPERLNANQIINRSNGIEDIHAYYIALQKELYTKEWQYDQLEAKLKVLTGLSSGIEDLCGWNRETTSKVVFDKKQFAADHPDLYVKYLKERPQSFALTINSYRPYAK